ncbi:uncharacterized protein PFL1_01496 [Pseudozyma flocculosa PF-1]|uniref:Alpha-L-rhamnosidase C-terminal domain-containing protein n=1 Tax=Pseudozyma flocculosa TaxID=84751 RepID=A0A5C3FDL1_9BASI|nr:uncharacterized protein PFL1_01496 [Pseudozyma flocculosa PF-1]EPQ31311.1 hypothetical protein PFL1_01496 [Pseudozyma flocculosa PF-1]SPO41775.1 uncharacterized protein PSFLO_07257 [Pseudozyma flocculosa]
MRAATYLAAMAAAGGALCASAASLSERNNNGNNNNAAATTDTPWPKIPAYTPAKTGQYDGIVRPKTHYAGLTHEGKKLDGPLRLANVGDTVTVDYARDVAGKPTFKIASFDGPYAQIEVKYTEQLAALSDKRSDGPFAFANALANTFRVETFNVTQPGDLTSYFIQGSQRWQSIRLVHGSNLLIDSVGFKPTTDKSPLLSKKGYFASSDKTESDIWALAFRTQQLTCYAPHTQTTTWDIDSHGAYIRGQKPASSTAAINYQNYTLEFDAKIDYGGLGWRLDGQIDAIQANGPYLVLNSNYPEGSFANYDRQLVPPNTLVLGTGFSLQNQTSLPGYVLDRFPIDFDITEKEWHRIKSVSHGEGAYTIFVEDRQVAKFNVTGYGYALPNPFIPGGTMRGFALGGWQDTAAWYKDVEITSNVDGKKLYSNPLTDKESVPLEFGVEGNTDFVCSDAGKRDRFSWLGDRLISSRAIAVATGEFDYVVGPMEWQLSKQAASGAVPINTLFGPVDDTGISVRTGNVAPLLLDYMFDFLQEVDDYWMRTGDDEFIRKRFEDLRAGCGFALSQAVDPETQLFQGLGQKGGLTATTGSVVLGLEAIARMADFVGEPRLASQYRTQANVTRSAMARLLYNDQVGSFVNAVGSKDFHLMDITFGQLADVGTDEQRRSAFLQLAKLKVPAGYKNGTFYDGFQIVVDPYFVSFTLDALAQRGETELAQQLVHDTWAPMVAESVNSTGALWEYVSDDGSYPGLEFFTAQSHFWGSGATVWLTEYSLGVRPTAKAFTEFAFAPMRGLKTQWNHGRVPTPHGIISAAWGKRKEDGKLVMELDAPKGTTGTIVPPLGTDVKFNVVAGRGAVEQTEDGKFRVKGGRGAVRIVQA